MRAITELRNLNRLEIQNVKTFSIRRVKSGNNVNNLVFRDIFGFSRRLGLCAKICMADSAGMDPRFWPVTNCYGRNLNDDDNFDSQVLLGNRFNLETNGSQKRYCSEYHRLYLYYIIKEKFNQDPATDARRTIFLPSAMFIIRQNFSEIIQISTTINVIDEGPNFPEE